MEQAIYILTLVITGILNILLGVFLLRNVKSYRKLIDYYRTRLLTVVWLFSFGIGYILHAILLWRYTWPTAASSLTVSYFHIGALCFSWGYTPLLNPAYLTRRVVIRDALFYLFGLIVYWSVALIWRYAPISTLISFCIFFAYAAYAAYTFYKTYNRVSYRRAKMGAGGIGNFVQWMQMCCDLIVLFGICSVVITAVFPTDVWPFSFLLVSGFGMFSYIVYSLDKYGPIINKDISMNKKFSMNKSITPILLLAALFTVSCSKTQVKEASVSQADSLITAAYHAHAYDRLIVLADTLESSKELSEMKAYYWRGYAYNRKRQMRLAENYWNKAIALSPENKEDKEYYAKSANRLSALLLLKSDYEGTMRVAMPAMEMMEKEGCDHCGDYANLLTTVGCCQLNLGQEAEAAISFAKAEERFIHIIEADNNIKNYTSAIIGVITITENYLQRKLFEEANTWTRHFENLMERYKQLPDAKEDFIDKQWARLNFYRACALEGLGYKSEAAKAYEESLTTRYAKTADGKLEATTYLVSARRWQEAADNFTVLDDQISRYNLKYNLENIQHYMLPKFRANYGAGRYDSTLTVASQICTSIDSAITRMRLDDATELAAVYNIQQKESEIAQQKADISRQRYITTVVVLILVITFFAFFITTRHRAALRLEKAFYELEIANAKAKESSRMKTAFIQQISHEIRTPLNILSGFTQVITTAGIELDKKTKAEISEKITENTNRITGLVNKMLELSDVNSRTVIERNDNVLPMQIAAQAAEDSMISLAPHLSFEVQTEEGIDNLALTTNQQQAARALSLILDNAKKYTKEGTVRLILSKRPTEVAFTVEDSGIGIPAQEAEHIFEEFVQLNEYNEGTGIGLTVARSICYRLGGDLKLDTSYTHGARFVMTLPTT